MIHVALFSFQRTTCCLSKLSLQATLLSYRIPSGLSRTFFCCPCGFRKTFANQGFQEFASAVSLSDLYYDTGYVVTCQHLFLFFQDRKIPAHCSCTGCFVARFILRKLSLQTNSPATAASVAFASYQIAFIKVR